jgi:filamentous hemagglutinin family protein
MKFLALGIILLIIISLPINAEITLDGTLGHTGPLPGPNYLIGAELGQQHGRNLFHSFRDFNLKSHESATFSGPNNVNNIIGRVTGGNPSNIDGLIRATIPNANLYFLNPYGILFGPNAKLDVQGSFHASTADSLRLGTDGQFNARHPEQSLLTVAPPEAFGFLTDKPAAISVQDGQLFVYEGKTVSLIGGDLRLNANQVHFVFFPPQLSKPQVFAESGRINLVSQASRGEVIPTDSGIHLNQEAQGGQITTHNSLISVSGNGGGDIFIRAGRVKLINSIVDSYTLGDKDGGVIDISADELELQGTENLSVISAQTLGNGQGSTINLNAKQLTLSGGAIFNATWGLRQSGAIQIKLADTLSIFGQLIPEKKEIEEELEMDTTGIFNLSASAGDAGLIEIEARQLILRNGGLIGNPTIGSGNSGPIRIEVTDGLIASGEDEDGNQSGIIGHSGTDEDGKLATTGNAAHINIQARQIRLSDGAQISSETFSLGTGGTLKIKVAESLIIEGQNQSGEPSAISASSANDQAPAGNAGQIEIEARQIRLTDGGAIQNATVGAGKGGPIVIVTDTFTASGGFDRPWTEPENKTTEWLPSGIFTSTVGLDTNAGKAGKIELTAQQIGLLDGGQINNETFGAGDAGSIEIKADTLIAKGKYVGNSRVFNSGITSRSTNRQPDAGKAGDIFVSAKTLNLSHDGEISTAAANATGGNIRLTTNKLLFLRDGQITTSVYGGTGDGGNIVIENPVFVILGHGQIRANADEGRGGNIHISADQFIASPCSQVSASSRLGLDGEVKIDAPEVNLDDFLVVLPGGFVDASGQLQQPCTVAGVAQSRFVVKRFAGSPPSPGDLQSNRLVLLPLLDEPRPNQVASHGSKDSKDASAGMAHNGLGFQSQANQESRVIDEQLF